MFGYISKREYDRLQVVADNMERIAGGSLELNKQLIVTVADLEARLAVFTAPRKRGPSGRFLSGRARS